MLIMKDFRETFCKTLQFYANMTCLLASVAVKKRKSLRRRFSWAWPCKQIGFVARKLHDDIIGRQGKGGGATWTDLPVPRDGQLKRSGFEACDNQAFS